MYRFENQWEKALCDLASCERLIPNLSPLQQPGKRTVLFNLLAKIFSTPYASMYDPLLAHENLSNMRKYNDCAWAADEIESELAFRNKEWRRSAQLADRAAEGLASEGWVAGTAMCRRRAGEAYFESNDMSKAIDKLTFAYNFFKEHGPPDLLASTQLAIARYRSKLGDHDTAWEMICDALDGIEALIRRFRDISEQQRFLFDKMKYYDHAFDIGWQKGGTEGIVRAWSIAERSKSFYLCQLVANAKIPLFAGVDHKAVLQLNRLEKRLDICEIKLEHFRNTDRFEEFSSQLRQVSDERQSLLSEIMKKNPRWAVLRKPPPLDIKAILNNFSSEYSLVSYFFHQCLGAKNTTLHIFFASKGRGLHCIQVKLSSSDMEIFKNCQERLKGDVEEFVPILPHDISKKIFPSELSNTLETGNCIIVSPHRQLRNIPIHAVDLGEKDYVIDHWPVQYIPTLSLFALAQIKSKRKSILIIGCPKNAFQPGVLTGVADEIESISKIWSCKFPRSVTKKLIKRNQSCRSIGIPVESWGKFRYIHIASHGDFPEGRPFDAALRLGTDALRTSEFFGANLDVSIMSLSACSVGRTINRIETFESVSDEWIGFTLPLLYAGVDNLLVSLWMAVDEVSKVFMENLHESLSQGVHPSVAFQTATKSIRRKDPSMWANWYLIGLPK